MINVFDTGEIYNYRQFNSSFAYQYSIVDDLLALILIVFIFIVNRAAHILLIPHKC